MASRYRRFLSAPLEYAELLEIAAQLNHRGVLTDVTWDIFDTPSGKEEVHFLNTLFFPSVVSTRGTIHYFQTGEGQYDKEVDEVLVEFLKSRPDAVVTCSHCYSHTYDNSDLAGAWAPNPSQSCEMSTQRQNTCQEAV